jgi:hypothetical protein
MSINQWNEDRLNEHLRNMYEKQENTEMEYSKEELTNKEIEDGYHISYYMSTILSELIRAENKFPEWPEDIVYAIAIMQEEAGEVAKAVVEYSMAKGSLEEVEKELIQTAAMCLRCLYNLPKF